MHRQGPAEMAIKTITGLELLRFKEVIIQTGTGLELRQFREVTTAEMPGLH